MPERLATTTWPESSAARPSIPVPTMGDSGSSSGTAWRCMFEPIRARFASSCSRNGISAVATRHDLLGADVHVLDLIGPSLGECVAEASRNALVHEVALIVEAGIGLRDVMLLFLVRGEIDDLVGHARADGERGCLLLLELGDCLLGELGALLEHDRAALGGDIHVRVVVADRGIVERHACA